MSGTKNKTAHFSTAIPAGAGVLATGKGTWMKQRFYRAAGAIIVTLLLFGCANSVEKRGRPFTDEWHDIQKRERNFESRRDRIYGTESDRKRRENRAADIVRTEKGDHALGVRAGEGVRADFDYNRGPRGGLKIDWDFARPDRD